MEAGLTAGYNEKYKDSINYNSTSVRLNLVQSFMNNLIPMIFEMGGNTYFWDKLPITATDFIGTALNDKSRNYLAGYYRSKGLSIEEIAKKIPSTIEGLAQL